MSSGLPRLSIVIPVYNEEKVIGETLRRVDAFLSLDEDGSDILVSSDGSTDRTASIVKDFVRTHPARRVTLIELPKNTGKGAAVRRGVLAAEGRYILVTDADLSTPVKESHKLIQAIDAGCDGAIGSRALRSPGADVQQSLKRRVSGRIFNGFVRAIALGGYHDTQCGFKCFKNETAKALFSASKVDGFSFDVEVLALAKKSGFTIKEVPVMWRQGRRSSVSLVRDSLGMVKDLFRIRRSLR